MLIEKSLFVTTHEHKRRVPIRNRHHHLSWMSDTDRHTSERLHLSEADLRAIAQDTRLPGEIAGKYGLTAAIVLKIQRTYRRQQTSPDF
jgi:hypothetical protein